MQRKSLWVRSWPRHHRKAIAYAAWLVESLRRSVDAAQLAFHAHRSDFDSLATMALADTAREPATIDARALRGVRAHCAFDECRRKAKRVYRRNEYRRLIDRAGVRRSGEGERRPVHGDVASRQGEGTRYLSVR
jgi:hypothetical protein